MASLQAWSVTSNKQPLISDYCLLTSANMICPKLPVAIVRLKVVAQTVTSHFMHLQSYSRSIGLWRMSVQQVLAGRK